MYILLWLPLLKVNFRACNNGANYCKELVLMLISLQVFPLIQVNIAQHLLVGCPLPVFIYCRLS